MISSNPIASISGFFFNDTSTAEIYTGRAFAIYEEVREPTKYNPTRSEFVRWKLLRVVRNLLYRSAKLIQKPFRRSRAALRIPISRRLGLLKGVGMDFDSSARHRSSRAQRRRSASSHGMSLTAPLSIC
jgi:hypothetical protein